MDSDGESLAFLDYLPKLRELCLEGEPVTDAGLKRIVRRDQLRVLSIDGSRLTDASVARLRVLTKLEHLQLRGAINITEDGIADLASLSSLSDLAIGTPVNEAGLDHLRRLPKLRSLSFNKANIPSPVLEQFVAERNGSHPMPGFELHVYP
jgi:hypothetical protein